ILIRTSYQKAVDEFVDVAIDGEIFHLRFLEDSVGPLRIVIPQKQNRDGRDHEETEGEDGRDSSGESMEDEGDEDE
ncbi:hypothetical protein A2U01_0090941, partial [Trifolium medium]|nr:hypothetical protein [Trifolium medium]